MICFGMSAMQNLPVVIPLLSERDLNTELHPHIVDLLKTPDK